MQDNIADIDQNPVIGLDALYAGAFMAKFFERF